MDGQLTVFELYPDAIPVPEMWGCMQSCRHCGEVMDAFPGTNKPRCMYGQQKDHISGGITQELGAERVHFYCEFYEMKEKQDGHGN